VEAARRARLVHEAQVPSDAVTKVADGATVTERYVPVGRAGVYVPGGLVVYPSSVVMNVIPAQVAGVAEIAVASPPRPEHGGLPHPSVLAACALLGVTEVHAAGGAQAIAMLGYGTADCPPVDTISGPGNVYVAAAKRLLAGRVGTDAEAGPTEIAIIADGSADPALVAADLVAQAEHDPLAACLLITTDPGLADRTDGELSGQVAAARHRERIEAALAGQSACVLWTTPTPRWRSPTPGRPSTWRSRPSGPPSWPAGSATRARCSSGRTRRCRSVTTWRAPITCCPPAGPPGIPRDCRC
jgi:histidinol dehydrogenase